MYARHLMTLALLLTVAGVAHASTEATPSPPEDPWTIWLSPSEDGHWQLVICHDEGYEAAMLLRRGRGETVEFLTPMHIEQEGAEGCVGLMFHESSADRMFILVKPKGQEEASFGVREIFDNR